ncbi:MAG: redoxin domain-containing protein [Fuerstiella sp.]|nr:redoxin domain-containing protein [Fuerstiella sp.]
MKSRLSVMLMFVLVGSSVVMAEEKSADAATKDSEVKKTVVIGATAPEFRIKDSSGKQIDLKQLTDQGPVLVRLTCGCSGCDKELAYFQTMHEEYKELGLTSLAIFREPDAKVEDYVQQKKLKMMYAVDSDGNSWKTFQTKTMPTNFLIEKGGKIRSIAAGCDPSGLLANKVSQYVADLLDTEQVDVRDTVKNNAQASTKQ